MARITEGNIRKSFMTLRRLAPEIKIDKKNYIYLANDYNKFLMEKVFAGEEVTLPAKLGVLSIVGRKQKVRYNDKGELILPPDWVGTKKLRDSNEQARENRTVVYHLNEETDGVRYKLLWSKRNVLIENKNLYSLKMTRANKRRIHREVTVNKKEYFVKY